MDHALDGDAQALQATLDNLVRNVGKLLSVPSVSVALLEPETGDLVTWAALETGPDPLRRTRFRPNEGVAGWVAARMESANIPDLSRDSRFEPLGRMRSGSMLCVPLVDNGQVLGTLTATSDKAHAFDKHMQQWLEVFSEMAMLAIAKTRQAEAAKAQASEIAALLDATHALTSTLEPTHIFAYIVASIRNVIACDDAVIYAYEEHSDSLQVVTGFGPRTERLGGVRVALSDSHSTAALVAKSRRVYSTPTRSEHQGEVTEAFLAGEDMALLCVPLISKDRLRGVIMLARTYVFRPDELGSMLRLSTIVAATLENVQLYQTARAEREQQAAIYAAASDAIAVVDDQLAVVEANDAFARLAGSTRTDVLGQRSCHVLHAHLDTGCPICAAEEELQAGLEHGTAVRNIECKLPNLDTTAAASQADPTWSVTSRYIDFSVTPVTGVSGRRLLLVGRDITAFREMEQLKVQFLAMVTHELRSPLHVISGHLELALSGSEGVLNPKQTHIIKRARVSSEQLNALIDDLLLITRQDAGHFKLRFDEINIRPLILDTVLDLRLLAEDADVTVNINLAKRLPIISADAARLVQVLRNLLTNAIKFTPAGGWVTISADYTDEYVRVRVQDSGVGILPQFQDKIFERFFQVPNASGMRPHIHGQGLGLAIVRIILDGHNAKIKVDSVPGSGSQFSIYLPRLADDDDDEL